MDSPNGSSVDPTPMSYRIASLRNTAVKCESAREEQFREKAVPPRRSVIKRCASWTEGHILGYDREQFKAELSPSREERRTANSRRPVYECFPGWDETPEPARNAWPINVLGRPRGRSLTKKPAVATMTASELAAHLGTEQVTGSRLKAHMICLANNQEYQEYWAAKQARIENMRAMREGAEDTTTTEQEQQKKKKPHPSVLLWKFVQKLAKAGIEGRNARLGRQ